MGTLTTWICVHDKFVIKDNNPNVLIESCRCYIFSATGPLCIFTEAFSLYLSLVLLRSWTPTTAVWVTRVKAPPDDEHQRCLQTNGRHSVAFSHFSRDLRTISTFDSIFPIDTPAIMVFYLRRWLSDIFSQSTGMNANHSRAVSPKKKTSTWKRSFNGGRMIKI